MGKVNPKKSIYWDRLSQLTGCTKMKGGSCAACCQLTNCTKIKNKIYALCLLDFCGAPHTNVGGRNFTTHTPQKSRETLLCKLHKILHPESPKFSILHKQIRCSQFRRTKFTNCSHTFGFLCILHNRIAKNTASICAKVNKLFSLSGYGCAILLVSKGDRNRAG